MDLTIGTTIHGFTLRRIRDVPGTAAQLVEMVYEKTGTELVWYKTDEPNKLFNVIFRTLPQDTVILPGHGPESTVGEEMDTNPYLQ